MRTGSTGNLGAWLALPLLLLAGCQNGPSLTGGGGGGSRMTNDPLLGGGPPIPTDTATARGPNRDTSAATVGRGVGNPSRPAGPLPPLPSPSGSTSPAALTSGNNGTLDPAATLRIGGGNPRDGDWRGPGETPKHSFQTSPTPPGPQPTPGGDTAPAVNLPPLTLASHRSADLSLEQLKRRVEALGAVNPQLYQKGGEWICTCRVPNRQNPSLLHVYEAAADTDVAAVQAILEQIEQDRR